MTTFCVFCVHERGASAVVSKPYPTLYKLTQFLTRNGVNKEKIVETLTTCNYEVIGENLLGCAMMDCWAAPI